MMRLIAVMAGPKLCRKLLRQNAVVSAIVLFVMTLCLIYAFDSNLRMETLYRKSGVQSNKTSDPVLVISRTQTDAYSTIGRLETLVDVKNVQFPYINRRLYVKPGDEKRHEILLWNPPGWMSNWWGNTRTSECSYANCDVVYDRRRLTNSSAVVFSLGDAGIGSSPPVTPDRRNPDQAWIFFTLESPAHVPGTRFAGPQWQNVFNWSWTYRHDADIFHPYGILQSRVTLPSKNYSEIFRRKTKVVTWLVSHCNTQSMREEYVKLMNLNGLPVTIYGHCGISVPDNYYEILDNDYKFYLAFENSFCPDYVTEKFFEYYKRDIVVVTRGSLNYTQYLPPNSFIDTANFTTVKELTTFLKELATDENRYTAYLKAKDKWDVPEREFMYRDAVCSICDKINNLDKSRKTYTNIDTWIGRCSSVNDLK